MNNEKNKEIFHELIKKYRTPCDCLIEDTLDDNLLIIGLTKEKQKQLLKEYKELTEIDIEFNIEWFSLKDMIGNLNWYLEMEEDDKKFEEVVQTYREELLEMFNGGLNMITSDTEYSKRSQTCFTCLEYYKPEEDKCKLCGCDLMHKKLWIKGAECPDKKWLQEIDK
jgi:hypothetical protein